MLSGDMTKKDSSMSEPADERLPNFDVLNHPAKRSGWLKVWGLYCLLLGLIVFICYVITQTGWPALPPR